MLQFDAKLFDDIQWLMRCNDAIINVWQFSRPHSFLYLDWMHAKHDFLMVKMLGTKTWGWCALQIKAKRSGWECVCNCSMYIFKVTTNVSFGRDDVQYAMCIELSSQKQKKKKALKSNNVVSFALANKQYLLWLCHWKQLHLLDSFFRCMVCVLLFFFVCFAMLFSIKCVRLLQWKCFRLCTSLQSNLFFFAWQQQQTINIQHSLMLAYYRAVAVFIVTLCSVGVVTVVVVFEM